MLAQVLCVSNLCGELTCAWGSLLRKPTYQNKKAPDPCCRRPIKKTKPADHSDLPVFSLQTMHKSIYQFQLLQFRHRFYQHSATQLGRQIRSSNNTRPFGAVNNGWSRSALQPQGLSV